MVKFKKDFSCHRPVQPDDPGISILDCLVKPGNDRMALIDTHALYSISLEV
jgi:hypothetical protein